MRWPERESRGAEGKYARQVQQIGGVLNQPAPPADHHVPTRKQFAEGLHLTGIPACGTLVKTSQDLVS